MKKVTLKKTLLVPNSDFCMEWKNQAEVCPMLGFRKDPEYEKILWKCAFYSTDLLNNINSIGIKKVCMEHETGNIYNIDGSKIDLK